MKIDTKKYSLQFKDDPETRERVFARLVDFFLHTEEFSGEQICQSDAISLEGPELLSEVVELMDFKVEWKEE